ncbi:MAG: DUF2059 domain-containing protein [Kiloniellales bacterium]|nr:DUF2059 domain-containing protein [Kiloniellales bacterium]
MIKVLLRAFVVCVVVGLATSVARADEKDAAAAKAQELMDLVGMAAIAEQLVQSTSQQIIQLLATLNPGHEDTIRGLVEVHIMPEFRRRLPEFQGLSAELYARHFTAAELDEVIAFYRTPVGQKTIEKLPVITQESIRLGEAWGGAVALEAIQGLIPELQERGLKAPAI